jgi:hypothetical protein
MEKLFTRNGHQYTKTPEFNEAGKPVYTRVIECERCGVVNGQRVWCMGMENGRAWSTTGFECWTCNNTGIRGTKQERLYTSAELAKITKAAVTRAANKQAKFLEAQRIIAEKRAANEAAYHQANAVFLETLKGLCSGDGQSFWDRVYADLTTSLRDPSDRLIAAVDAEVAKRAINVNSAFIGDVGDKITITITIEKIITIHSQLYGNTYLHLCRDQAGDVIVYKGTANIGNPGETNKIKATVKEHQLYDGVQQTVIQRPKLVN